VAIGLIGSDKFDQKNYQIMSWIWVNLIRIGLGFVSNIVYFFGFRVILGRSGSGFGFLVAQVISSFELVGFGSGRVSGHLISGSLGFRIGSGLVRLLL
jgi:hypothetical protein